MKSLSCDREPCVRGPGDVFCLAIEAPHASWATLLTELFHTQQGSGQIQVLEDQTRGQEGWRDKTCHGRLKIEGGVLTACSWESTQTMALPLSHGLLNALVRRWSAQDHTSMYGYGICGSTLIDPLGLRLVLRQKEAALLCHLMSHPPGTRHEVLAQVWGYGQGIETHTLESHVWTLRHTLASAGSALEILQQDGCYVLSII